MRRLTRFTLWALAAMLIAGCATKPSATHKPGIADSIASIFFGSEIVLDTPPSAVEVCTLCDEYTDRREHVVRLVTEGGLGSGVVISEDGLILTNAHVVGSYPTLAVQRHTGEQHFGTVVYAEPDLDMAVVTVESPGVLWHPAHLERGHRPRVGSEVFVIGHPLGLGWTLTRGVVSAWRPRGEVGPTGIIQTDAAVSPGNSGGAMLDPHGHVVGLVSSKAAGAEIDNISFAIDSEDMLDFLARAATALDARKRDGIDPTGPAPGADTPPAGG